MSITQRSGAGCSITALSWSSDCEGISSRQTSLGESTKPTSPMVKKLILAVKEGEFPVVS